MFPSKPDTAQHEPGSGRPQHPPTQLGLSSEMSKHQDFLVTAVTPTRLGEGGWRGVVVAGRCLQGPILSCPPLSTAPNPPCTHRSITVTTTDPEPSNRATAASPHCPPRSHHRVLPAHSTALRIPFHPLLPKPTPSSRPPTCPSRLLTAGLRGAHVLPRPPRLAPTPGSQHGRHLPPCAALCRAVPMAKPSRHKHYPFMWPRIMAPCRQTCSGLIEKGLFSRLGRVNPGSWSPSMV